MTTQAPQKSATKKLIQGYQQFKSKYYQQSPTYSKQVTQGQHPKVLIVSCCDSRIDPALVMGCEPGEIFVVRNVANLIPPFESDRMHHGTSAALEFGVNDLEVTDIIVFGHSHCGGIRALMSSTANQQSNSFINAWMDIAEPAKQRVLSQYPELSLTEQAHHCERESLINSLNNLSSFPWIKERVDNKQLFLHAWYFNLATGGIDSYQADRSQFVALESTNK